MEDLTNLEAEFGRFEIPEKLYQVKKILDIYFYKYQQVELFINQNSKNISISEERTFAVAVLRELREKLINTVDDAYQAVVKESYTNKLLRKISGMLRSKWYPLKKCDRRRV